jgi:membrane-bound metal-dependent hydrolase YbcI (DUF457 family)
MSTLGQIGLLFACLLTFAAWLSAEWRLSRAYRTAVLMGLAVHVAIDQLHAAGLCSCQKDGEK